MILDGLKIFAIGFGMVFVVLGILIAFLSIMKNIFSAADKKAIKAAKEKAKAEAERKAAEEPVPVVEPVSVPVVETVAEEDDSELIAVITAAIAAATSENGASLRFRVTNVCRLGSAWNSRNRMSFMNK